MSNEDELIESGASGDKVALQSLLLIHYQEIESAIRQNLGGEVAGQLEVQDLIQEVLVAVYRDIGSFSPTESGSFRAWLKRIAHNRVIDAARKARCVRRGGDRSPLDLNAISDSLDNVWDWVFAESNPPDRPVRAAEAREAVQVCLARLADDQREAVIAYYFEHRDTEEIATRMNRSPGAVRELLRRARANLAEGLGTASMWLSSR